MRRLLIGSLAVLAGCGGGPGLPGAPSPGGVTPSYRVFTGDGAAASLQAVLDAMGETDVVLLGERHDDSVGHVVQAELLVRAWSRWGEGEGDGAGRPLVLSLEMFERDVQVVLDEYLGGIVPEEQFLAASRAWDNYDPAYRRLVELARARGLPVVAANVPRRYVNLVSREGRGALERLDDRARAWLPPLPYPGPSARLRARFDSLMAAAGVEHTDGPAPAVLDAQALWDAGMAHAVVRALDAAAGGTGGGGAGPAGRGNGPGARTRPLALHVSGAFHVEGGTGIVEVLRHYRADLRVLTVTIVPADGRPVAATARAHAGLADFVVVTSGGR